MDLDLINSAHATANLCMIYLGHSKLNIDGHCCQICQCGAIKTELHIFFNVLPPIQYAKSSSQMFLKFLLMKIYFPTLNLLH